MVLPPSMHSEGYYKFRNNRTPSVGPVHIDLSQIDNLLSRFSSRLEYHSFGDESVSFDLVEEKKIKLESSSFVEDYFHVVCTDDSLEWLIESNTDENKNSLAIRYLIGDDVEKDFYKALDLFKEANTQTSIFNLLSLYAVEGFLCSYYDFWELFSKLNQELFGSYVELIKHNAEKNIKKPKECLFFDTECNGLPDDYKLGVSFTNNWPRMIQLAWIVTDEYGNILKRQSHIIYPHDFTIDSEVEKLTGISTLRAQQEGVELKEVLSEFMNDLANADEIIGHNVDFDFHIVGCELYRTGGAYDELMNRQYICTMQASTYFCAIPSNSPYGGYKWPKLEELYRKLFGRMFDNAHDALADVVATKECFFALKQRGIVK